MIARISLPTSSTVLDVIVINFGNLRNFEKMIIDFYFYGYDKILCPKLLYLAYKSKLQSSIARKSNQEIKDLHPQTMTGRVGMHGSLVFGC